MSRGAEGWGWDEVLPYFKKVERDLDFDGLARQGRPHSGARITPTLDPARQGGGETEAKGLFLPDQNGEFVEGLLPGPHSNAEERRVGGDGLSRRRDAQAPTSISTDTQVKSLLFEGTQCVGVTAMIGGKEQEFRARK